MDDWPNVVALLLFFALGTWILAFSHLPVWKMAVGVVVLFIVFVALVLRFTIGRATAVTRGAP